MTFVDWRDLHRWKLINDALGIGQPEPAETYSTSEHLFADLSIPPGATGSLPRELRGARAGLAAEAEEDLGETGPHPVPAAFDRRPVTERRSRSQEGRRRAARAVTRTAADARTAGQEAAEPRAPRRRRRTRSGRDVAARRPRTPPCCRKVCSATGERTAGILTCPRRPRLSCPRGRGEPPCVTARGEFAVLDAMPAAGPCELGTALLVPGYTGSKEDFIAILGQLAAAGRRVIAVDQRGQYETAGPDDPDAYDLRELGADIAALADATQAAHLLGHSFGGLVAREAVLGGCSPASLTLLSSGPAALPGPRAEELHFMLNYLDGTPTPGLGAKVAEIWNGVLKPEAVAAGVAHPVMAFLEERMLANNPTGLVTMATPPAQGGGQDR